MNSEDSKLDQKPEFRLIPVVNTPVIDKGEIIEIDFYLTGSGMPFNHPPDNAKLYVNFGGVDLEEKGKLITSICGGFMDDGQRYVVETGTGEAIEENDIPENSASFVLELGNHYFMKRKPDKGDVKDSIPPLIGEVDNNGRPPIKLQLPASDEQEPGDYNIQSILTYEQNDTIESDKAESVIHVNSWVGEHEKLLKCIGLSIGLTGIVLASASFGIDIIQFIR